MTATSSQSTSFPERLLTVADVDNWRQRATGSIGLVPTLGALHAGHLELIRRARAENNEVVVSIFVNPLQFGESEDFERYPRDFERDVSLLHAEQVDAVFVPDVAVMYPPGSTTTIRVGALDARYEGASRPEHFTGVATVVAKLFNICRPDRAYFGEKDYQQLTIIKRMVRDLNIPLDVVGVETVRDPDGLAISSRNVYLTADERDAAAVIPRALLLAQERFQAGERDGRVIVSLIRRILDDEPLVRVEYIDVVDPSSLDSLDSIGAEARILVAVHCGSTRLIDNVRLSASVI
jgi:pantoate--beta-alanine ligase